MEKEIKRVIKEEIRKSWNRLKVQYSEEQLLFACSKVDANEIETYLKEKCRTWDSRGYSTDRIFVEHIADTRVYFDEDIVDDIYIKAMWEIINEGFGDIAYMRDSLESVRHFVIISFLSVSNLSKLLKIEDVSPLLSSAQ